MKQIGPAAGDQAHVHGGGGGRPHLTPSKQSLSHHFKKWQFPVAPITFCLEESNAGEESNYKHRLSRLMSFLCKLIPQSLTRI